MRQTLNTQVYCRPSKANKQGLSPLEVSIIVNGKRTFLQLPYKAKAEEFNRKRRPKELQEYATLMQTRVNEILLDMARNGEPVTAASLKEYLRNGGYKSYTVGDLFNDYLHILSERVGISITKGVYRKYELVRDLFFEHHSPEKDVTTISPYVIQTFHLKLQKEYKDSTTAGYMTKLHSFIIFGTDNGRFHINPFQGVKVHRPQQKIDYLTDEELKKITNAVLSTESLREVRDAFLLECYSGLSYADLRALTAEDINETDGVYYICKDRVKTGVNYTSVILPEGVEILRRYNFKMRIISNQKMNLFLKAVEQQAGIHHNLHCHLGRKTYGHILLNNGVRIESVAKALGHSNSKTTAKYYAELRPDTVVNEVAAAMR